MYEEINNEIVTSNHNMSDQAFVAVMRCLLRTHTHEHFYFEYYANSDIIPPEKESANEFFQITTMDRFRAVPDHILLIINVSESWFDQLPNRLEKAKKDAWDDARCKKLLNVEQFVQNSLGRKTKIYIFEELQSAVIFTFSASQRVFHLLASFLPLYFPKVFGENPISNMSKSDIAVMNALTKTNERIFMEVMMKRGEETDIHQQATARILKDFEKRNRTAMLENEKANWRDKQSRAEDIYTSYIEALRRLDEINIRIEGLQAMINADEGSTELMDYFASHKNLHLVNSEGGGLEFIVNTYLDSFDVEGYEHLKQNQEFFRHYSANPVFPKLTDRKLFMDALFNEDPQLKIKLCAYYKLSMSGEVRSAMNYDYTGNWAACQDRLPNPHLDFHNCLGNNRPLITKQINEGELLGAIECCFASAGAVNIHETSQTFRPFMDVVMKSDKPIIYNTETKQDMTVQEAMLWLKAQRAAKSAPAETESEPEPAETPAEAADEPMPF